jgi:hypothetical protein
MVEGCAPLLFAGDASALRRRPLGGSPLLSQCIYSLLLRLPNSSRRDATDTPDRRTQPRWLAVHSLKSCVIRSSPCRRAAAGCLVAAPGPAGPGRRCWRSGAGACHRRRRRYSVYIPARTPREAARAAAPLGADAQPLSSPAVRRSGPTCRPCLGFESAALMMARTAGDPPVDAPDYPPADVVCNTALHGYRRPGPAD